MPIGIFVTMFVRIPWTSTPGSQRRNVPWQCEKTDATELHSLPHCLAKPERPRAEGLSSLRPGSARLCDCRKPPGACRGRLSWSPQFHKMWSGRCYITTVRSIASVSHESQANTAKTWRPRLRWTSLPKWSPDDHPDETISSDTQQNDLDSRHDHDEHVTRSWIISHLKPRNRSFDPCFRIPCPKELTRIPTGI